MCHKWVFPGTYLGCNLFDKDFVVPKAGRKHLQMFFLPFPNNNKNKSTTYFLVIEPELQSKSNSRHLTF